jgi:hypothetical protein
VFVDLGSSPGAGPFQNTSDGLIWLTYFNHSGHVFSLDLEEDFAVDLAERFRNVPPFNAATHVARDVVVAALSAGNRGVVTTGSGPSGKQCLKTKLYWDAKEAQQLMTHGEADHFCRVPRWRAGYGDARVRARWPDFPPPAPDLRVDGAYVVKSLTMDDIWNEGLLRAHVDFLKIDVDLKWDSIGRGFRDIVSSRAFSVLSFEVDPVVTGYDDVTAFTADVDRLVNMFTEYDYGVFLKWPCGVRGIWHLVGSPKSHMFQEAPSPNSGITYMHTAYLPISGRYKTQLRCRLPPGKRARVAHYPQDDERHVMLVGRKGWTVSHDVIVFDLRQPELLQVVEMGNGDCGLDFPSDLLEND